MRNYIAFIAITFLLVCCNNPEKKTNRLAKASRENKNGWLSYDIVKAHGGEIKVETKEGEGSEFIILLPLNT